MTDPAVAGQLSALTAALESFETRIISQEVPKEAIAGHKSAVDDQRQRLWGVLSTGSADDYRSFQERFRLRRAGEICEGIESELSNGLISPRHEELRRLGEAAGALARRIQELAGGAKR
jgi:GTPase